MTVNGTGNRPAHNAINEIIAVTKPMSDLRLKGEMEVVSIIMFKKRPDRI